MIYEVELSRKGAIRLAVRLIFCATWYGGAILRDAEFYGNWVKEKVQP